MIYILKNIGKGRIGLGERQLKLEDLLLIKDKAPGLASQVQADYAEENPESPAYIKNKPEAGSASLLRIKNVTLGSAYWTPGQMQGDPFAYFFYEPNLSATTEIDIIPDIPSFSNFSESGVFPHGYVQQNPNTGEWAGIFVSKTQPPQDLTVTILLKTVKDAVIEKPPLGGK